MTLILLVILVAVMPREKENVTIPEKTTKEIITELLNQKFNQPANALTIGVTIDTGSFAKGTYNEIGAGGGIWFAAKTDNGWELASAGNGIASCGDIGKYDFPKEIITSCLDDGNIVDPSWLKIKNFIENCEVKSVFQNHNREVSAKLKNGNEINAIEPEVDDVIDLATSTSSKCGDVTMSTE